MLTLSAIAAEQPNPKNGGGRPPTPRPSAPKMSRGSAGAPGKPSGEQQLDRFLKMSPEERQKALSNLPAARRERIQNRLNEIEKMGPARRTRVLTRLEILNSLPPERQQQVRQALQRFQRMPEERHALVQEEMRAMTPLTDEERRERMNSEEFRNRYTPAEQQMMKSMLEVVP